MSKNVFFYLLLFFTSFSFILFQFALSRELSYLLDFFSFTPNVMIIFSLSGLALGSSVVGRFIRKDNDLAYVALAISLSLPLSSSIVINSAALVGSTWDYYSYYALTIVLVLGLILSFTLFGLFFGGAYQIAEDVGRVLFFSSLGLAFATYVSGRIFSLFGFSMILVASVALLLPQLFFWRSRVYTLLVLVLVLLPAAFPGYFYEPKKGFNAIFYITRNKMDVSLIRYSDYSRIDVVGNIIFNHGNALTFVNRINYSKEKHLGYQGIPYLFTKPNPRVLVIGAGGGLDIAAALSHNASKVTGVEINPVTIGLMENEFLSRSGRVYKDDRVDIVLGEGRAFATKAGDKYDAIILHGTDTFTQNFFTSFTPVENYLYTLEAFREYWGRLDDDGVVFITRFEGYNERSRGLVQMLKIYMTVVRANFTGDFSRHFIIVQSKNLDFLGLDNNIAQSSIILSKKPLDESRLDDLRRMGLVVYYYPGHTDYSAFGDFVRSVKSAYDVDVLTDDRPNFYNFLLPGDTLKSRGVVEYLLTVFIILPMICVYRLRGSGLSGRSLLFMLLGMGFIAVELTVLSKLSLFLEVPVYAIQYGFFSFILFGGIGSYYSVRFERRIREVCVVTAILLAVCPFVFNFISATFYIWGITEKIILSVLLVAPLGFLTGIPFPVLLARQEKRHILYAVDGVGTIMGGVLTYILQVTLGFNAVFVFAAILYGAIAALASSSRINPRN